MLQRSDRPGVPDLVAAGGLAYVIWRPVSNGQVLYPVLAAMTAAGLAGIARRRSEPLPSDLLAAAGLLVLGGLVGSLVGLQAGNRGLAAQAVVWFGSLAVWAVWALTLRAETVRLVLTTVAATTLLLGLLIVLYVGARVGYLPDVVPDQLLAAQDAGIDVTGDGTAIRLYGLSSLTAAGPLIVSAAVLPRDGWLPSRWLLVPAGVAAFLAAAVAGRRAVLLVMLAAPLLLLVVRLALRRRVARGPATPAARAAAPVGLGLAVWLASTPWADPVREALGSAAAIYGGIGDVSAAQSLSDHARQVSAHELLAAWWQSPLVGQGLGAELASGFARSADRPWAFELQYHQLLLATGLVGALCVAGAVLLVARAVVRAARRSPEHEPALAAACVAAICLLIANASNPYLQAVGHGWGVALVAAVAAAASRGVSPSTAPHQARSHAAKL